MPAHQPPAWIKENGFFSLADVSPVRTWNYELPTLVQEARFTNREALRKSETFWKLLTGLMPAFEGVSLDGVAIVGGCVVDLLLGRAPNDVDLFLVLDDDVPNKGAVLAERVRQFVEDLLTWMKGKIEEKQKLKKKGKEDNSTPDYNLNDVTVTRYKNVYTIKSLCLTYPVQFTFCPPLTRRFQETDISCTEAAYFRGEVIFSERGRQGIESLVFTVNPKSSSPKYIERIIKYFEKGFDIVLPELDVSKIPMRNIQFDGGQEVLDLPFLLVWISDVKQNKVFVNRLEPSKNNADKQAAIGSGALGNYDAASVSGGALVHQNIRQIIRGHAEDLLFQGKGELYADAFLTDPLIPPRMVNNTYETVRSKLFTNGALDFSVLEDYFTVRPLSEILNESVIKFLRENSARLATDKDKKLFGEQFNVFMKAYIQQLIAEQVEAANRMIAEVKGKGSLEDYHTGLKPEKACTPAEWYGPYFRPN